MAYTVHDIETAMDFIAGKFTGIVGLLSAIQFAKAAEDKATVCAHHGLGMTLRNELGLWGKNKLTEYFKRLGISHPDDMSGILLTCFHRKLNGNPYAIDGQVEKYKKYWADQEKEEGANV